MHDVIIVGGGPAGLSAALVLGRSRRRVLVVDAGRPRNRFSEAVHGYFTRDGERPMELLRIGREQTEAYGVEFMRGEVTEARRLDDGFEVIVGDGRAFRSRKLVLATGVRDVLPGIPGIEDYYGRSVHHCPYCDGWEWRDARLAAYGRDRKGVGLALMLKGWSDDVVVFTNGPASLEPGDREKAAAFGIDIVEEPIARLEGEDGMLRRVVLESGRRIDRDAMFFNTDQVERTGLAAGLGCEIGPSGGVEVDHRERTGVPGLFVIGDVCKDMELVIVAAAEGAKAAVTINHEFQVEDGRILEGT